MRNFARSFAAVPVLVLAACSNPADGVPAAQVSDSTNSAAAKSDSASNENSQARTYTFGPASSKIEFVGSKVTGRHDGGFTNFVGELRVVDGNLADTGNKVVIATDSLWSDNDRLTGHLKSADFFDAATYPTAIFETISVAESGTNSTVTGNLTLHGITKQISFPAAIEVSEEAVVVNADFVINRFDFNMKYSGKADDLIRQEVVLRLNVNATPGSADFSTIEKTRPAAAAAGH